MSMKPVVVYGVYGFYTYPCARARHHHRVQV